MRTLPKLVFLLFISRLLTFGAEIKTSESFKRGYEAGYAAGLKNIQTCVHFGGEEAPGPEYTKGFFSGQYDGLRKFTADKMGEDFFQQIRRTEVSELMRVGIDPKYKVDGIEIYVQVTRTEKSAILVAAINRGPGQFDLRFDVTFGRQVINRRNIVMSSSFGMAVTKVELMHPMNIDEMRSKAGAGGGLSDYGDLEATNLRWMIR